MNDLLQETIDSNFAERNVVETVSKSLPPSASLKPADLQVVADALFCNQIKWETKDLGFMTCPGHHKHTSPNNPKDCRITIDQGRPPTVHCFHNSCKLEVDAANKKLRTSLGKNKWTKGCKLKPKSVYLQQQDTPSVEKVSPLPLPTNLFPNSTLSFLRSLFEPDEFVAIHDCRESDQKTAPDGRIKYSPGAGSTQKVADLVAAIQENGDVLNLYQNRRTLFIRANPMGANGKSDKDVSSFRYVLVDIDKDENEVAYPLEAQFGALIASKLPLASVTYSGDISLAALVRVDAPNLSVYKERKREVYERMSRFVKIDESCGNPSRWTRCPGGVRHVPNDAKQDLYSEQRLIALNEGAPNWEEYKKIIEQENMALTTIENQKTSGTDQSPRLDAKRRATIRFTGTLAEEHSEYGIEFNGNKPIVNLAVVKRVLQHHPEWAGKIFYDQFLGRVFTTWKAEEPSEWNDINDSQALIWLQQEFCLPNANIEDVRRAIFAIAHENQTNCLREWLLSLEWDHKNRLLDLLCVGFGAEGSDYHSKVGECLIISMVARAMEPGCKVDTIPVFEGDQGAGKSSGLRILGGKFFTECHEQITSKDFYGVLKGRLLIEISEMHSFKKADSERIKGIISNQSDRYRLPYDKHASDHPRQCVFAGTTNRNDWHNDDTGGRRFWPVRCGKVDLEWLKENREQLFAEAVVRYLNGQPWWTVPEAEQRQKIDERRAEDPWFDEIAQYLENHENVAISEVLSNALNKPKDQQGTRDTHRVATILKELGYERYTERDGRKSGRKWRRRQ